MNDLDALVGDWSMTSSLLHGSAEAPRAHTTFEWLPGERFLVQRWEVGLPEAPDGIAIIGYDSDRKTYLQHYFDSRGVARVYEMTFGGNRWTLQRLARSPDFSQRFIGILSDDGSSIIGRWESSTDGSRWQPDFDLTYTRVR